MKGLFIIALILFSMCVSAYADSEIEILQYDADGKGLSIKNQNGVTRAFRMEIYQIEPAENYVFGKPQVLIDNIDFEEEIDKFTGNKGLGAIIKQKLKE